MARRSTQPPIEAESDESVVDLPDPLYQFEDVDVLTLATKITKTGDGLSKPIEMGDLPVIHHTRERGYLLLMFETGPIQHVDVDDKTSELGWHYVRKEELRCIGIVPADPAYAAPIMEAHLARIAEFEEAERAEKARLKKGGMKGDQKLTAEEMVELAENMAGAVNASISEIRPGIPDDEGASVFQKPELPE